jgi:hypothetical protein
VEEPGRDVERKEVAVHPLPAHRCLEQSLVFVHCHAEQSEALRVLGSPGTSHVVKKQRMGLLLLGWVQHLASKVILQPACKSGVSTPHFPEREQAETGGATQQGSTKWLPSSV